MSVFTSNTKLQLNNIKRILKKLTKTKTKIIFINKISLFPGLSLGYHYLNVKKLKTPFLILTHPNLMSLASFFTGEISAEHLGGKCPNYYYMHLTL